MEKRIWCFNRVYNEIVEVIGQEFVNVRINEDEKVEGKYVDYGVIFVF